MRVGLSHQFLSQALILEVHLFCVFPAACREFPILNRRGAENLTEGPGGRKGRSGTWNPLILLGCREAGWIGKGLLCKALVYRESLSPDPLPASAGFAETGRGGHATTGVTRPPLALPALSSPTPGQLPQPVPLLWADQARVGVGWGMNTCARWEEGTPRRGARKLMPHLTLTPRCPIAMLLKFG